MYDRCARRQILVTVLCRSLGALVSLLLGTTMMTTPAHADVIIVSGTGDAVAVDGVCTLREAIQAANPPNADVNECVRAAQAGTDRIESAIPGVGVHTIAVTGNALPTVTEAVVIDGYTQPGANANSDSTRYLGCWRCWPHDSG